MQVVLTTKNKTRGTSGSVEADLLGKRASSYVRACLLATDTMSSHSIAQRMISLTRDVSAGHKVVIKFNLKHDRCELTIERVEDAGD